MASLAQKISGFYAILDSDDADLAHLLVRPVNLGGAGARVLQVRIKPRGASAGQVRTRDIVSVARMAREVTAAHGALLVIDDRLDIALAVGADGVHLGQDDLALVDARAAFERASRATTDRPFLIGISTHDRAQVQEAVAQGADYLGFGPVFATSTKDNPDPVQGVDGLQGAVAVAGDVPIVAIGGITPENVGQVVAAGAAAACSIAAVNHVQNQAAAGAAMSAAFARGRADGFNV